jgi:hypothetical protein
MRDYLKLKPLLPDHITAESCRLALSVWRNNPSKITDALLAMNICERFRLII